MKHTLALLFTAALLPLASAETVKVGATDVTLETPSGFAPLSKEQIAMRWPGNAAPTFVVGNETAFTSVAYDVKKEELPQEKLPEIQASFTKVFERIIPGIIWKKNEIIEQSGQKWILMEFTTNSPEVDVYNMVLLTGYKGHSLLFNFNSTRLEFPKNEAAIRESLKSIKIPQAK